MIPVVAAVTQDAAIPDHVAVIALAVTSLVLEQLASPAPPVATRDQPPGVA